MDTQAYLVFEIKSEGSSPCYVCVRERERGQEAVFMCQFASAMWVLFTFSSVERWPTVLVVFKCARLPTGEISLFLWRAIWLIAG